MKINADLIKLKFDFLNLTTHQAYLVETALFNLKKNQSCVGNRKISKIKKVNNTLKCC